MEKRKTLKALEVKRPRRAVVSEKDLELDKRRGGLWRKFFGPR